MRCPRILLADDAPEIRALLALVLGRAGADVRLAVSGAEALALWQEADAADAPFDAIVLDREMPGLDGDATETRLRARGCAAPIVVLDKPTRPDAVLAVVARCLVAGVDAGEFRFESGVLSARGLRERVESLAARFAEGLPERARALEGALAQGDVGEVSAIAQRLEDVAGTYGFANVAEAAAELDDDVAAAAGLDQVRDRVARVAELCRRAATARLPL
jgi:CheY-like chemotaxis protein